MNLIHFTTINSTNSYAKVLCEKAINLQNKESLLNLHGTVITAQTQTSGRGRLGRSFYSPDKSGLYMSMIFIPKRAEQISQGNTENFKPVAQLSPTLFTTIAAVAVCHILDKNFGIHTQIKWVNDIYLNGKKVCGILTEGVVDAISGKIEAIIIGIGINVGPCDFPAEIKERAGAVGNAEVGKDEITQLAKQIAEESFTLFSKADVATTMNEYRERSFLIGKNVIVHPVIDNASSDYSATVTDICEDGKLRVRLADGTEKLLDSGEVSVKNT